MALSDHLARAKLDSLAGPVGVTEPTWRRAKDVDMWTHPAHRARDNVRQGSHGRNRKQHMTVAPTKPAARPSWAPEANHPGARYPRRLDNAKSPGELAAEGST